MNNALEALIALATLFNQLKPLADEVIAAAQSSDETALQATLAKLQAANDALMGVPQ